MKEEASPDHWWAPAQGDCLFNDSRAFSVRKLRDKSDYFRPDEEGRRQMIFHLRELTHRASGKKYYEYSTFRDEDDGGNTIGWIETHRSDGREIVAQIGDSEIIECKLAANAATASADSGPADTRWWDATPGACLFNDGAAFSKKKVADTVGSFKPNPSSGNKHYHVRELVHIATDRKFIEFSTFRDEDDGGNTIGWIETASDRRLVVEIADSGLYRCILAD